MGRDCANIAIDRDGVIDAKVARILSSNTNSISTFTATCIDITEKGDIIIVTSLNYKIPDELLPVVETLPVTLIVLLL